ncbi:MAG TPA: hypothetical protein PKZ62_00220, partial [Thermoclostridium caenicola]|nr:hypothetical protein [Thermoclostridium caenicola]
ISYCFDDRGILHTNLDLTHIKQKSMIIFTDKLFICLTFKICPLLQNPSAVGAYRYAARLGVIIEK